MLVAISLYLSLSLSLSLFLSSSCLYSGHHKVSSPDHVFSGLIMPRAVGRTCQKRVGGVTKGRAAAAAAAQRCLVRS